MHTKTFDSLCLEVLEIPLSAYGYTWVDNGAFVRKQNDGIDSIGFDIRPSKNKFTVMICYEPKEFEVINELHPEIKGDEKGYLCQPYLNPNGTSWNPKWWKCQNKTIATNSLHNVLECIENKGFKWLELLRDKQFYADHSDPIAAISSGYAHELAGNFKVSLERYNESKRRFDSIEKSSGIKSFKEGWRDYIFIMSKLGIENSLVKEIRELSNWNPDIPQLNET